MPGHAIAPFLCAHKMFSVEYSNLCALTLVLFLAAHTQAENSNMQMIVLVKSLEQSCSFFQHFLCTKYCIVEK